MLWAVIVYILAPCAILNLVWKGLRYRPYFDRWGERFGFVPRSRSRCIWLHAVSVGEVRSASGLIRTLLNQYPRHEVLVTTMTPTGGEQVRALFDGRVSHAYVPFDLPDAVKRFLDRVAPDFAVIAETEFWPNLFAACRSRRIPLFLVNVRISADSLAGYLQIPRTVNRMLSNADLVCAQTRTDAQRLRNLGVPNEKIHITGNLKFDIPVPDDLTVEAADLRRYWGADRPVWVAGSTHAGEEKRILDAYARLKLRWPSLLLVLVPRNPERFSSVARYCCRRGYKVCQRSEKRLQVDPTIEVYVCDSLGELQLMYAAGDIAYVGASLVKLGGHNILESCAVGVPVIFGPHMFNFEDIAAMAVEVGAASQIYDVDALIAAVDLYLSQPSLRRAAGRAAIDLVASNHGSLETTVQLMKRSLARTQQSRRLASQQALSRSDP